MTAQPTAAAGAAQVAVGEHEGLVRMAVRRFVRHRLAMAGLIVLTTIILIAAHM